MSDRLSLAYRLLLGVDLLLVVWVAGWALIGVLVANDVQGLSQLSSTVVKVGRAGEASGAALKPLAGLPFVGVQLGKAARQITEAGASAERSRSDGASQAGRPKRSSVA